MIKLKTTYGEWGAEMKAQRLLVESNLHNRAKLWVNVYKQYTSNPDFVKPNNERKEVLRATLGNNTGEAERLIVAMLKGLKLGESSYKIDQIAPSTFIPEIGRPVSGDYTSYKITMLQQAEILGDKMQKGDFIFITNKSKQGKTGEIGIISRKALTPDRLGVTKGVYNSVAPFQSLILNKIADLPIPENYKEFLTVLVNTVAETKTKQFASIEEFIAGQGSVRFKLPDNALEGIDQLSLNNIMNDFGELLDALMLLNITGGVNAVLSFPQSSNAKMVDFYFNGWSISSKAGAKGGTPTGDTIMQEIYKKIKAGEIIVATSAEQDFYKLADVWVNYTTLSRSSIYSRVFSLCQLNQANDSGFSYLKQTTGMEFTKMTEDAVVSWFDELYEKDIEEFKLVLSNLWTKCSMSWTKGMLNDYTEKYKNLNKRVGVIMYPLCVEATRFLNQNYTEELTKFTQLVTNILQLYISLDKAKNEISFNLIKFKQSKFKFEQKGSIPNPFNSNIGIATTK